MRPIELTAERQIPEGQGPAPDEVVVALSRKDLSDLWEALSAGIPSAINEIHEFEGVDGPFILDKERPERLSDLRDTVEVLKGQTVSS